MVVHFLLFQGVDEIFTLFDWLLAMSFKAFMNLA
jgi:hypothetical protein